MNKDIFKYLLLAAGAYMLYKWLDSSGYLNSLLGTSTQTGPVAGTTVPTQVTSTIPAVNQLPAGTPGGTVVATGNGTTTITTSPVASGGGANTVTAPGTPDDAQLMAAAYYKGQAGATGNYRLSAWQWNWYRQQAALNITGTFNPEQHQTPFSDAEGSSLLTAAEYHALLAGKNVDLSGIGWGGGAGYAARGGYQ